MARSWWPNVLWFPMGCDAADQNHIKHKVLVEAGRHSHEFMFSFVPNTANKKAPPSHNQQLNNKSMKKWNLCQSGARCVTRTAALGMSAIRRPWWEACPRSRRCRTGCTLVATRNGSPPPPTADGSIPNRNQKWRCLSGLPNRHFIYDDSSHDDENSKNDFRFVYNKISYVFFPTQSLPLVSAQMKKVASTYWTLQVHTVAPRPAIFSSCSSKAHQQPQTSHKDIITTHHKQLHKYQTHIGEIGAHLSSGGHVRDRQVARSCSVSVDLDLRLRWVDLTPGPAMFALSLLPRPEEYLLSATEKRRPGRIALRICFGFLDLFVCLFVQTLSCVVWGLLARVLFQKVPLFCCRCCLAKVGDSANFWIDFQIFVIILKHVSFFVCSYDAWNAFWAFFECFG